MLDAFMCRQRIFLSNAQVLKIEKEKESTEY
jgi:hypothetical protein